MSFDPNPDRRRRPGIPPNGPAAGTPKGEPGADLFAALETLPDDQFRFMMSLLDGDSFDEAAANEGISRSAVQEWLRHDGGFMHAMVELIFAGLPKNHPKLVDLIHKSVQVVAEAAQRGESEAVEFVTQWMEVIKRRAASQN